MTDDSTFQHDGELSYLNNLREPPKNAGRPVDEAFLPQEAESTTNPSETDDLIYNTNEGSKMTMHAKPQPVSQSFAQPASPSSGGMWMVVCVLGFFMLGGMLLLVAGVLVFYTRASYEAPVPMDAPMEIAEPDGAPSIAYAPQQLGNTPMFVDDPAVPANVATVSETPDIDFSQLKREGKWDSRVENWPRVWPIWSWDLSAIEDRFQIHEVTYDARTDRLVLNLTAKRELTSDDYESLKLRALNERGKVAVALQGHEWKKAGDSISTGQATYLSVSRFKNVVSTIESKDGVRIKAFDEVSAEDGE